MPGLIGCPHGGPGEGGRPGRGRAEAVPGLAALNTNGDATVSSVSCAAPGECSAGGVYMDGSGFQGFVLKET